MALDRQMELVMDAMQASHDAMLGHMANVREAMSFEPLADPEEEVPLPKPKPKEREASLYPNLGYGDEPPKEGAKPKTLPIRPPGDEPLPKPKAPTGEGIHSEEPGETQVAGDVVPIQRKEPIQLWNVEKPAGYEGADPSAVASAHMRGSLKVLRPTGEERK